MSAREGWVVLVCSKKLGCLLTEGLDWELPTLGMTLKSLPVALAYSLKQKVRKGATGKRTVPAISYSENWRHGCTHRSKGWKGERGNLRQFEMLKAKESSSVWHILGYISSVRCLEISSTTSSLKDTSRSLGCGPIRAVVKILGGSGGDGVRWSPY